MAKEPTHIIVAGASAGGLNAFCEFVAQLHEDMDAAVFLVLHLSKVGIGNYLLHRLQQFTLLPCSLALNDTPIIRGHIYIAPPDYHVIVKKEKIIVARGPTENRWRPSIDVLFRSAAAAYGDRVIGIVLSGLLNDGEAGMIAIKKSGGSTIVQDPNEAEYPDMPLAVLNSIEVDYCVPLAQLGYVVFEILGQKKVKDLPVPPEIIAEAEIAERTITSIEAVRQVADKHSIYACPDCGGGLWEINEDKGMRRYRCHIGHAYSEPDLVNKQSDTIESTLWVALRMMEERRSLLMRISNDEKSKGLLRLSENHQELARDLEGHISALKSLLISTPKDG